MQKKLDQLKRLASQVDFMVNSDKTKLMIRKVNQRHPIILQERVDKVSDFRYLRSTIDAKYTWRRESEKRE